MKNPALKGFIFAITAALLWGVSGTFGQFLFQQREINVEWLISIRMLVSGALLLLYALMKEGKRIFQVWKDKKDAIKLLLFSITGMLMVQYTYFAAIKHSNAATATVLQYSGPVLIAIYLAFVNKRLPGAIDLIAILFAVLGTFLLVTQGNLDSLSISPMALFLGLASAVALATYTLQPISLLRKYSSTVIIGWGMLIGGVAISMVKAPWHVTGIWDQQTYYYTAFVIVFGTLIPFYLYLGAVQIIGAQKSSLLASAEPLSAAIVSILWLDVSFGLTDWIGSLLIISTVLLISYNRRPNEVKAS